MSNASPTEATNGAARTTEHLARKAHDTVDRVAEKSAEAESELRERADKGAEKLRETEQKAKEAAEQSAEKVTGYIKDNPMTSAGMAFVAGVFLSSLLRR